MSMRVATLGNSMTDVPATREALPASQGGEGSFSDAMNDARQADAPAPINRTQARKMAPGTEAGGMPVDDAPAGDPAVAALLAQLLSTPAGTAADIAAVPPGMQGTGTPQASRDAGEPHPTHGTMDALDGMNAAMSTVQSLHATSSGLLTGLAPAAPALDKRPPAVDTEVPMAGLPDITSVDRIKSASAPGATPAQSALSSFTDASHSGEAQRAEIPASATASGASSDWAALMANLSERSSGAMGHPGTALALNSPSPEHWKEPLLNSLGERVQWQIQRGSEQARIRLEPPHLGQIDIVIRQEAGQMQVHLSATHREVAQQLQGISDGLRQALSLRQAADVQVQVSDPSTQGYKGQGQGQRQGQQDASVREPGRALSEPDDQGDTR